MGDEIDFAQAVDAEVLQNDDITALLDHVVDEDLYSLDLSDSMFEDEINTRVECALDHLNAAARLRAAEVAHQKVRDEGHEFVHRNSVAVGGGDA